MNNTKKYFIIFSSLMLGSFYTDYILAMDALDDGFSIGRQVISQKHVLQVREEFDFVQFDIGSQIAWDTILIYGLTESLGLQIDIPIFFHRKLGPLKRRGLGDISLGAQWQFYRAPDNRAIFTGGLSFPTGHSRKSPFLGTGSFDFSFSLSFIHSSDKWFASALFGPDITTTRKKRRIGSTLNYEFTFGPKFTLSCIHEGVLAALVELDGEYGFRVKIDDVELTNSGGHIAIFGPLISFEQPNNFIIQGRVQLPVTQRLFGPKQKVEFVGGFSVVVYF